MNTEITTDVKSTNVENLHHVDIDSSQNETNKNKAEDNEENTNENNLGNKSTESHCDKSMEAKDIQGIQIDDKGGTSEKEKDKCYLNSNSDPKNLDVTEYDTGITKESIDSEKCINGNSEQGIDLIDNNLSNITNLSASTESTKKNANTSDAIMNDSVDSHSRTNLVDDDNCNNQDKGKSGFSTAIPSESFTGNAQVNEVTGDKSHSTDPVKDNESLEKSVSSNNEQLSTNIENVHISNTNSNESLARRLAAVKNNISKQQKNDNITKENECQVNKLPTDINISDHQKNAETTEEISENIIENDEESGFNIAMVVVQDKPSKIEVKEDSKDNKKLLQSLTKMVKEKVVVMPDPPLMDQQEQPMKLPEGWKRETVQRSRKNKMDIYYVSPTGLRLRSEGEVYRYIEQEKLELDISLFDFGYDEVALTDSDTTITVSEDDSDDDQVVWASTGRTKRSKEPVAKAKALNPFDIVNSQMSKRVYLGQDLVLIPKVIPYKVTVNAKRQLPEFLKDYTVLRHDDYLAFRTKEQFWQEPFMKRIYEAIDDREISLAEASELVGVRTNKLNHEFREATRNPWLTEAFSEYLANNEKASTSQNGKLEPIRAASPSQKIPSMSRPGGTYTPSAQQQPVVSEQDMTIKRCSCKKSECIKTSCVCFNNFEPCRNCACKCCNNTDNNPKREEALKKRLTKMYPSLSKDLKVSNAAAMAAMIAVGEMMNQKGKQAKKKNFNYGTAAPMSTTLASAVGRQITGDVQHGCTCLNTPCHNISCECFSKGLNCSDACLCITCSNKITMHGIFGNMHSTPNLPLNPPLQAPSQFIEESVTDSIRRLFPQVIPQSTIVPTSIPINLSKCAPNVVVISNAGTNFASNNPITKPIFVPRALPSKTKRPLPTSIESNGPNIELPRPLPTAIESTGSNLELPTQPKTNSSTINAFKGLEDKETFLHKWVEANYMIDASNFWEENLIFLHLKNTIERLGLGHVVTLSQLRDAVSRVFGPGVGPNKHLGTRYWLYTGIKPVLAHPSSNNSNTPSTAQSSEPATAHSGSTLVAAVEDDDDDDVCIIDGANGTTTVSQIVTIPSTRGIASPPHASGTTTPAVPGGAPMVTIHSVESLAASSTNATPNNLGPLTNVQYQKNSSNKEDYIINWLKLHYKKTSGSIDMDVLYQKFLSNLATTNKLFSIAEFISCVKYVFGENVGPKPCYDAKGTLRWHFVGIWSKDASMTSTENSRSGSTTDTAVESDDDVCIIDGDEDNDDVEEDQADKDFNPVISEVVGGNNSTRHPTSTIKENNIRNVGGFFPIIENVYSEPQTSNASSTVPQEGHTAPARPPPLTGPHMVPSGPSSVVVGPFNEVSGITVPPAATVLTNPAGPTVAKAVETGFRVQRGPDWIHGDEDGHGFGTVTELSKNGTVRVVWDCNKSSEGEWYNMGLNGMYRLRPAEETPRIVAPGFMPSPMMVRPPAPLLVSPSTTSLGNSPAVALGNLSATSLGHPSVSMLGNPHGPMLGINNGFPHGPMLGMPHGPIPGVPHGAMLQIPPGLMLNNHHGPILGTMPMNFSGPTSVNPSVGTALGNIRAPAPLSLSSHMLASPPQAATATTPTDLAAQLPIMTHHRLQVGTVIVRGPNWHQVEEGDLGKGLVLEVQVVASKQYARVKWNDKSQCKSGWYCYTSGEIQLAEGHNSVNMCKDRRKITHPSGLSKRERTAFSKIARPRVGTIETEELILEWILTNLMECPGAMIEQVEVYQTCKKYMDKRGMKTGGPIVLGNIMRKIFGIEVGPKRTEIDGVNKWRYQGITGVWRAQERSAEDRVHELLEKYNEINQQQAKFGKEASTQISKRQEETETIVRDSTRTYSSTFEGHNFSPQRSDCLRNSRSPSPMSRSPSPLSTLSPASSMEQLSDLDSHDGTNLDLEDSIFDDSNCISDTDICDTETVSHTRHKDPPSTHLKFPACPYDPIEDRKMWLLYMDTFGK